MLIGIRSFNYNKKAYSAYALMNTNIEELEQILHLINFENDTDPDKVFVWVSNKKFRNILMKNGWKPLDIDKFPEIYYKDDVPF